MTQKHAPRGRIKGADPMDAPNPLEGFCRAKSKRSGVGCRRRVVPGALVCAMHGGKAPQVQAKALERLMALQHPAIDTLSFLMEQKSTFPSTAYAAARDGLDRTEGKAVERLDLNLEQKPQTLSDADLAAKVAGILAVLRKGGDAAE
jgi:hypothetical protein